MNDFELFQAMTDAQEKYDALLKEYRRRGLDKKAYCQFSRFASPIERDWSGDVEDKAWEHLNND